MAEKIPKIKFINFVYVVSNYQLANGFIVPRYYGLVYRKRGTELIMYTIYPLNYILRFVLWFHYGYFYEAWVKLDIKQRVRILCQKVYQRLNR